MNLENKQRVLEIENNLHEIAKILKRSQYMELQTIAQEAEFFEATRVFKNPTLLRKVKKIEGGVGKDIFKLDYEVFQARSVGNSVVIERAKKYTNVSTPDVQSVLIVNKDDSGNFSGGSIKIFDHQNAEYSFKITKTGEVKNYRPVKTDRSRN